MTLSARVESHDAQGLRVRFSVSDTGIGIAPDVLARLFAPFTQGDASMTRRHGGMGMGLAICRSVVESHRGRLSFRENPGGGAVFTLLFPLATR